MALRPFVLDCDTGRDDALAIWTAIALGLPLSAIVSSYGNVKVEGVTDNTARVLALAGREDILLWSGATQPSQQHVGVECILAPRQKNSGNGLCNLELPRSQRDIPRTATAQELADRLAELAAKVGPLDYIITGPATNFYQVCEVLGTKIHDVVARVTMMGGKFDALWEQIPGGDFNVICDPYAVRGVLKHGFVMRFVPMNATWPIQLPLAVLERLVAGSTIGEVSKELMIAHCRHFAPEPVFRFHDPSVVIAVMHPEAFAPAKIEVICDEQSPDFGRLVVAKAGHDAQIYHTDATLQATILQAILENIGLAWPDA